MKIAIIIGVIILILAGAYFMLQNNEKQNIDLEENGQLKDVSDSMLDMEIPTPPAFPE